MHSIFQLFEIYNNIYYINLIHWVDFLIKRLKAYHK